MRSVFASLWRGSRARTPILVFQMGKVGSTTVTRSLVNAIGDVSWNVPVLHRHVLANFDEVERRAKEDRVEYAGTALEISEGRRLRQEIDGRPHQTWNVVTLVREPVGRNVAAFFETLHEFVPDWTRRFASGLLDAKLLHEIFLTRVEHLHRGPERWFDEQMRPVFGIDVYRWRFPHEAGYQLYRKFPKIRLLLIRSESLNACASAAMHRFLGLKDFRLDDQNVATSKPYAELYAQFMTRPLPREYAERMYGSKYARHFYTPEEIERFTERWTR